MTSIELSVIIPVFNGETYLEQTIQSVLFACKNLDSFEILISDNHSTDLTPLIINQYVNDKIRQISPSSKLSIGENWSFVSAAASGQYIKFLGADDVLYGNLSEEIQLLKENPECVALISKRNVIDKWGNIRLRSRGISSSSGVVNGNDLLRKMWRSGTNLIGDPSALLFQREPFLESLPWVDNPYPYVVDLSLYVKCFTNQKVLLSEKTVSGFRIHSKSVTGKTFTGQAKQFLDLYHDTKDNLGISGSLSKKIHTIITACMAYMKQFAKIFFILFISKF